MKFNTIEEMVEAINTLCEGNIENFEFEIKACKIEKPVINESTTKAVTIASLGGNPIVEARVDDAFGENVLFVKSFESIPMSCGTGKVAFMGREVYTNICEADEAGPTINLAVIEDGTYSTKTFRLKLIESDTTNLHEHVMILSNK